jgi:Helix-turn-helix domain
MTTGAGARPSNDPPFTQAPDWMLTAPLSMQARMLYWALLAHVNRKRGDDRCWPSMEALAEMLGLRNRQSVARYVRELEEFGAIEVDRNPSSTKRQYVYTVRQQPPAGFAGSVSIAGWHRARHERMDAEQVPGLTEVHLGRSSEDDSGACTEVHENHTNATHTNEPPGTTPSGGHAYAAGTSSSDFAKTITPHAPDDWASLTPGKAAQYTSACYVRCCDEAGVPVYDEIANNIGRNVKARLEGGHDPARVWALFVSTMAVAIAGKLHPKAAA